ncbi:LytR family transcriptional regulator [Nocardia colli]|uniref:LytR family transcriptional regulator n=1 Tax=Nocardia colli TaxID=2545717 RepID=A0A5N0EJD1_9NOCA|nr:LCP family protein [Nocardia colli]KAA8887481.1 LytR family transcriptional regulator [Nocardia colli]
MDELTAPDFPVEDSRRVRAWRGRRRSGGVHRRPERRVGRTVLKVVAGGVSVAVLAGTAVGWATEGRFDKGFTRSAALGVDAPRSLAGDVNILLIGLDTRKDQDGNDLPKEILDQLHAGDGEEGGYNANTLILVHIPADMKKIVAVSIPRDDYVKVSGIPGYTDVKIKEAYGLKKAAVQDQLINQGTTDSKALERAGREAGRASIVQAVRDLTGVPIDRFGEVTLAGFYDLAKALGGVEVCLNKPVNDSYYSGADFPAGRQRLDPAQSLAFVRQRHGLENGDLDRTRRQQAFLTSVALDLRKAGTFTDVSKLSALMDVAHRNIVLSDGWNITDFLRTLGSSESPAVEFRTLPVLRYDNINGQDVNIIDPAAIRREVRAAFGDPDPAVALYNPPRPRTLSPADPITGSATPTPDVGKPVDATITGDTIPCVN